MKLFFDTMVYLHFKSLTELNMSKLFGTGTHTLIVPRITLSELDKHKNIHRFSRVRERAGKILRLIEKWVEGEVVRAGVVVEFLPIVPTISYPERGLRDDWSDDILLATILQYKEENPSESVVLVTQDTGLRMKGRHVGITVRELPGEYKLPQEPDPVENENRELRATVRKLQSALPKLSLVFADSEEASQVAPFCIGPSLPVNEEEIQTRLAELRAEFPDRPLAGNPFEALGISVPDFRSVFSATSGFDSIIASEFEQYDREVSGYLSKYEEYLRAVHEIQDSARRGIRFTLRIQNAGTAPADDVDIQIHFPDGFRLFSEDALPGYPVEPSAPVKPRTQIEIMKSMATGSFVELNYSMPVFNNSGLETFKIERSNSYDVTDHFQRIKQGSYQDLPEMFLVFDSFETARSFNAKYSIQPANLPEPVEGVLHFVIEKSDEYDSSDI